MGREHTLLLTSTATPLVYNAICNVATEVIVVSIPAPGGLEITQCVI